LATGKPAKPLFDQASTVQQVLKLGQDLFRVAQKAANADIGAVRTLLDQLSLITNRVAQLTGGTVSLWMEKNALHGFIGKVQAQLPPGSEILFARTPSRLMQVCLEKRQACVARTSKSKSVLVYPEIKSRQIRHALAVPLLISEQNEENNSLLGVIQVERTEGSSFTLSEIELVDSLAIQSAIVLQSSLHMVNEFWRQEQFGLVREVSQQITSLRDLGEIARRITRLILQTFDYYYVTIFILDHDQNQMVFCASAGPDQSESPLAEEVHFQAKIGEGIIGHVAQTGQELLVANVQSEPHYRKLDLLPLTRSEIALPLIAQDKLLGVLDVQSNQPDDFDEIDVLVLRTLAGNIAVAIEDAQLYQNLHRRATHLQAIYEVSSAITSILDQDELLSEVVKLIKERFGYSYVHLYSLHQGSEKIFYEAGSDLNNKKARKGTFAYDLNDPFGLIPWVARTGQTALVNDVREDARYRPSKYLPTGTLSEMTIPLVFGEKVLGVLDVQSTEVNAFGAEDQFLFEALADHVAIAMRNAYLYRSEVWRRGVADSLQEVAGLLSADVDLDQVLTAVLTELEHTLPLDVAAIWLLDETTTIDDVDDQAVLHLAAVRGVNTSDLHLELGLQPEEVLEYNLETPDEDDLNRASEWMVEAIQSATPVVRSPGISFEPLGAVLGFPQDYSALAAPLRIGETVLGLLVLAHKTAGRYGSDARVMSAAFASYAAVAIENARLFDASQEQAWISSALLQVADATQSADNLPDLLETVIRITPTLAGVKACLIYIRDEEGMFAPAAASGLNEGQQQRFEQFHLYEGDVPALDRLLHELRPAFIHGKEDGLQLLNILSEDEENVQPEQIGFPVLVPMLAHGEVFGIILVNYSTALPVVGQGKSLDAILDERLSILQGIAHQTAVAVDNIRLLKSQKEEAYISVVLLQVAQAVVSANDLDEALSSIVRITPILVGVTRVMVYLWDEDQNIFIPVQTYGLPRATESLPVARGEFPLLDAVLMEDSLLALPINKEGDIERVPENWMELFPPDRDQVDGLLAEEGRLLLALPLSVKGKRLGVFLAEEPDLSEMDIRSRGSSNRRLRAKRIEIIKGISQQSALAIQNEILQQETLKRERLEREMQLAREIQTAFLPQNLQSIPGWDLQVFWRPAREVGGDFYDFFLLPDGRLGLVIADVADKGLPAAMFMVMVRTLVRATVQVLSFPAEVVTRVNNLLVPDATKGMFVTLVYAVLDLKTGELIIANAGHNPPFIIHRPFWIERAERGGMALGVEERKRMDETRYLIEPDEFLVLYTDGVTEEFSPSGEMFGESRLKQVIAGTFQPYEARHPDYTPDASEVLKSIDEAVMDFCGAEVATDDLTLLVLKRLSDQDGLSK